MVQIAMEAASSKKDMSVSHEELPVAKIVLSNERFPTANEAYVRSIHVCEKVSEAFLKVLKESIDSSISKGWLNVRIYYKADNSEYKEYLLGCKNVQDTIVKKLQSLGYEARWQERPKKPETDEELKQYKEEWSGKGNGYFLLYLWISWKMTVT